MEIPMIELSNVSKKFQEHYVLDSISFSVKKSQSYVILGQSGVGKTTLLKMIGGLIDKDFGSIKILSENIGMLFQKNALFDSLTVFENLDFTLRERTTLGELERRKLSLKYLEFVELSGKEELYPSELSGGMQKRLAIARTLILNPEVILYDEPTAGLDPITSKVIADLILKLQKEMGTTIIMVTSDIFRAYQLGNQLGLLVKNPNGSRLIQMGTPEEAKNSNDPSIIQFIKGKTKGPLTNEYSLNELVIE
jgi:phospholipid/cholesterol/gamma-HCH transport system ATP-binding protein